MNNITIAYLFRLFIRKLAIIMLTGALFSAAVFSYCKWFATPVYKATAQLIISNGALIPNSSDVEAGMPDTTTKNKVSSSDITASVYVANVCVGILDTPGIYERLSENIGQAYTKDQLNSMVSVGLRREDEIFINISTTSTDPNEAIRISNEFANLAPEYINDFLPEANAKVTAQADRAGRISPQTASNTSVAFIIGIILTYLIAFIVDINDRAIKGEEDFTMCYNIPILGVVPDFDTTSSKGGYTNAIQE